MTLLWLKSSRTVLNFTNLSRTAIVPSGSVMNNRRNINSETIDTSDLKHLSKFAAEWWDPEGPLKALHSLNPMRVPFIRDSLVSVTPNTPQSACLSGKKILEVGCGGGFLTEDLAKLGADMTAIEPSKELFQTAKEHAQFNTSLINKPNYINTTIEEHVKKHSNEYDAVIASEVIEHINIGARELFLESCVKALKPGGKIIISTPNRTRMSQLIGIYFLELFKYIPRGTHYYHKFITPNELKYWLELNDCRVDFVQGYVYKFWSNQCEWSNWQALMYVMRAVKLDKSA